LEMQLSIEDMAQFFRIHRALMFYVNRKLKIIDTNVSTPDKYSGLPLEARFKVHEALTAHIELIDAFADENPFGFDEAGLEIVRSWKDLVTGTFYAFRQLRDYMVFLSSTEPVVAYGVVALFDPFETVIGPYLPRMIETTLLPFKGLIVYDGLVTSYNITFGAGIKRRLNASYKEAKARHGIVASLPMSDKPLPRKAPKAKPAPKPPSREEKDEVLHVILGLIDQFCKEHLNEEYAILCRKLAEKLARKRPSPLLHGSLNAWASGIVRAVGGANFLHDKSQTPYMRSTDIDHYLGTSPSSGAAKLAAIRKMLKIHQFDPNWTLPSRMDDNPLVWMLEVNGLMVDVRHAPREVQEIAFNKGLIPYIPADRQ
jgi:Domain of unknown function (DUF6398)